MTKAIYKMLGAHTDSDIETLAKKNGLNVDDFWKMLSKGYGTDGTDMELWKEHVFSNPDFIKAVNNPALIDAINKGYSGIGDWIEGVGAIHVDPFAREFHVKESSKIPTAIYVQKCMNSAGEIIWKQPARPTSIQEALNNTPTSDTLYDLQGRRLTSQPSKGVYIQSGKKVVVR